MLSFFFLLAVLLFCSAGPTWAQQQQTPIVIWHGMGDSCCNPISLGGFSKHLEEYLPGVYVHSLRIGNNIIEDTENGFFMQVNKQVQKACLQIKSDPNLKDGFNAIGFSQGAQFLRALAQRCPDPPMLNLISLGGQHQGVYGLPHCFYPGHKWCDYVRKALNHAAYESYVQKTLVQAQYWHDPLNEDLYRNGSMFLADVNNEQVFNQEYRTNLLKLQNLVLVKFNNDSMVEPRSSEWFGFYAPGQAVEELALEDTDLYKEDRLGLKVLNDSGRLHFLDLDGDHLEFTREWFNENIADKYLKSV
ncbi:palmitoyl-protein thioesterase 1 [Neocloeon triangulifer]|uniref:palmitoyl-protein thioesterase 1 n=1 Tax=Neocloeon triangulifer TaxID=2078957 RepID=UPI00286F768C|nr:palmitoyl-protein thioesterase 1 [Neocloeon triangulifer]